MCKRLENFLAKKKNTFRKSILLLVPAFHHAILSIVDKIRKEIDDRECSCGIFLDSCKAVDVINHEILLNKIDFIGMCGIARNWFSSYFANRQQTVSKNGITLS